MWLDQITGRRFSVFAKVITSTPGLVDPSLPPLTLHLINQGAWCRCCLSTNGDQWKLSFCCHMSGIASGSTSDIVDEVKAKEHLL
jgi:hypothetical protein